MLEARAVAAEHSHRGNAFVASVDYRLAPAHRYPVQLDDCRTVMRWIRAEIEDKITAARVWAGGASAGAVLATSLALAERDVGRSIHGLLLAYPGMHLKMPAPSAELGRKIELLPPLARFNDPRAREVHYRDYLGPLFEDPPPNAIPSLPTCVACRRSSWPWPSTTIFARPARLSEACWRAPAWNSSPGLSRDRRTVTSTPLAPLPLHRARWALSPSISERIDPTPNTATGRARGWTVGGNPPSDFSLSVGFGSQGRHLGDYLHNVIPRGRGAPDQGRLPGGPVHIAASFG
jgi:acetyl esterase/lipase